MNRYEEQITEVIQATEIQSAHSFSWFGKPSPRLNPKILRESSPEKVRRTLVQLLEKQFYKGFYGQGFAAHSARSAGETIGPVGENFLQKLSEANHGTGCPEGGWTVRNAHAGHLNVVQNGLEVYAVPGEYEIGANAQLVPGTSVKLRMPKEMLGISAGFYMAIGNVPLPQTHYEPRVRLYWNVSPQGAIELVGQISRELNAAGIHYKMKVLKDPEFYTRCDGGVVYILKRDFAVVAEILQKIYPELMGEMNAEVPGFTKMLAPGLALAEDSVDGESYGMRMCGLLAEGLVSAHEAGIKDVAGRLGFVKQYFAAQGIDFSRPYLQPGSVDNYTVKIATDAAPKADTTETGVEIAEHDSLDTRVFLETSQEIAHNLCETAIWHQGMCNWVGMEDADEPAEDAKAEAETKDASGDVYKALSPKMYSGSSGIALYLAEMYAETGDPVFRKTATGAMLHAFLKREAFPENRQLSFFAGALGVAYCGIKVGILLENDAFVQQGREIVESLEQPASVATESDIVFGKAGAILGLLALRKIASLPGALEIALRLGDALLESAEIFPYGWGWRTLSSPRQPCLTGFSHGSAGIGLALLELHHVSGEARFLEAGRQAFAYEQHWYDAERKNWPDFRGMNGKPAENQAVFAYGAYWCHGAVGIALARLRAYELLGDAAYKAHAEAAIATTTEKIRGQIETGTGNYSLCHGIGGNAVVPMLAAEILPEEFSEGLQFARTAGLAGIRRFKKEGQWPCGSGAGETQGLMLGLAGIGLYYLRLFRPEVPGVLLLR